MANANLSAVLFIRVRSVAAAVIAASFICDSTARFLMSGSCPVPPQYQHLILSLLSIPVVDNSPSPLQAKQGFASGNG
jgi:hypothetical protein